MIWQHKPLGFYVEGLVTHVVSSAQHVMRYLDIGASNRTLRATDMNATSSRSHTIMQLMFTQVCNQ